SLTMVDHAEVVNKDQLRVFLKFPTSSFIPNLATIQSFSVVAEDSLPAGVTKMTNFPPGTGPFKFVRWDPAKEFVVARFDDYWGDKAYLDSVVFKPVPDSTARFNALRSGDVDLAVRVPLEFAQQLTAGQMPGLGYVKAPQGA